MKCLSLHINDNYRGFVVRKLKSMDWDRIRIFLEVARTGMRVNRQHMDVNRASMVHSLFPDFIGGPDEEARKHGVVSGRRVLRENKALTGVTVRRRKGQYSKPRHRAIGRRLR
jgi:hypothetical protein